MNRYQIDTLFSFPVLSTTINYRFDKGEEEFLLDTEFESNELNSISKDRNVLNNNELRSLRRWLLEHLSNYTYNILQYKNIDPYITQSWVNRTNLNESHHTHNHVNCFISGVFFISEGDSNIRLIRKDDMFPVSPQIKEYNLLNSGSWDYATEKGRLLLFPSTVNHCVRTQFLDKPRYSLSFNTWVRGELGNENNYNYLKL